MPWAQRRLTEHEESSSGTTGVVVSGQSSRECGHCSRDDGAACDPSRCDECPLQAGAGITSCAAWLMGKPQSANCSGIMVDISTISCIFLLWEQTGSETDQEHSRYRVSI